MSKGNCTFKEAAEIFFDEADVDGSGCLTDKELGSILIKLGFTDLTGEDVLKIFEGLNPDGDKKVTKDEFLGELSKMSPSQVCEADLERLFKCYDQDGSGYLTKDEVKEAMAAGGYEADACACIEKLDDNDDGQISVDEFKDMFKKSL